MAEMRLPVLVFGSVEVHRLQRELESLEDFLDQAAVRAKGKAVSLPRASRLLEALEQENHLNFLQAEDRAQVKSFLEDVATHAPTVHMSFAADPSSAFVAKIVTWLRGNVHPLTLLQLGLQPTIAAGCIVRTASKTFDFSLRASLHAHESLLARALESAANQSAETATDPQLAATPGETPHER